jgi:hypothetical protein
MRRALLVLIAAIAANAALAATDLGELVLRVAPSGYVAHTNTVARPVNGSAAYVRVTSGATLAADSASWPDGASVLAVVVPAGTYSPAPALQLVGYGVWPTNAFQMVAWRVGGTVRCNVISEFASAPSVAFGSDGPAPSASPVGWTYLGATVVYQANGNAVDCVLAAGETFAASTTGWIDGQSVLVSVHPAGSYSVAANLNLVGYSAWPTSDFYAVVWRVGANFYANIIN